MLRKPCIRCGGKTRILTRKKGWYRKCRKCVSKKCGIYWHVEEDSNGLSSVAYMDRLPNGHLTCWDSNPYGTILILESEEI
jgi:hypothetical protein